VNIPTVELPTKVPRDAALVKARVDLNVHLRVAYGIGAACALLGAALLWRFAPHVVAGTAGPPDWGASGIGVGLVLMGGSVGLGALGRRRARLRALTHGRLLQARVVSHGREPGRRWLLLRGREQHVVRAAVTLPDGERRGEFRSPFAVEEALPVGSQVAALVDVDTGAVTFPHELLVGIELRG